MDDDSTITGAIYSAAWNELPDELLQQLWEDAKLPQ